MKQKINAKVYCRNNEYGKLDFYIKIRGKVMYLFTTDFYSRNIHSEYYNGKVLDEIFSKTDMVRQQKLKERIIRMVKYTEQENQIVLLSKSGKSHNKKSVVDYDYEIV